MFEEMIYGVVAASAALVAVVFGFHFAGEGLSKNRSRQRGDELLEAQHTAALSEISTQGTALNDRTVVPSDPRAESPPK